MPSRVPFQSILVLFSSYSRPDMALSLLPKQRFPFYSALLLRSFRSDAALEALATASKDKVPNLVLYNYPSFSGAFSALFAYLYHSHIKQPCIILPFSFVAPFRLNDLCTVGLETCYFLDFLGPRGFAMELSKRTSCKIIGFDHRKRSLSQLSCKEEPNENLVFHLNLERSSSFAAYEYFSSKLSEIGSADGHAMRLFSLKDGERVETVLKYIEDGDLRRWSLPDSKAFNIGICEWRSKLNCILNPHMYEQLMEMSSVNLIARGNYCMSTHQTAANELLTNMFRVRLGRGFYGECLGVKIDGNSDLVDEIGKELSRKSAAAGLRPIGAVIYMQRKNLKMSLRSIDSCTDTSEIAKAYGGGGSPSSSSFMIRMDEYNKWI